MTHISAMPWSQFGGAMSRLGGLILGIIIVGPVLLGLFLFGEEILTFLFVAGIVVLVIMGILHVVFNG
jgi:hypothetical protein